MLALDVLAVCMMHVCIDTASSAIELSKVGWGNFNSTYNIPPFLPGDAAYPVSKTLLMPYPETALTGAPEPSFNLSHCRTRVKVE